MRCAENDVNEVGEFFNHFRQCVKDVFNPLCWREEAKSQQRFLSFNAKLVLVVSRVHEWHVRNAVRNEIYAVAWNFELFLQNSLSALSHHDEPRRQSAHFFHNSPLFAARILQHSVKIRYYWQTKSTKQRKHMTAGRSA